mmetsp:Transcript_735/g.1790  ORF Transcript_735/g.1790 Transcript_735/m.1790 type:complete len:104 (-) Transcript_735:69-380(-)
MPKAFLLADLGTQHNFSKVRLNLGGASEEMFGCRDKCSCAWWQHCYPWLVVATRAGQDAKTSQYFDVGVCGDAVPVMVVYLVLTFASIVWVVVSAHILAVPNC